MIFITLQTAFLFFVLLYAAFLDSKELMNALFDEQFVAKYFGGHRSGSEFIENVVPIYYFLF